MITKHDIQKLAALARIEVAENDMESFQKDLERILSYVGQLDRAETGVIEPLKNVMGLEGVMRHDDPGLCIEADSAQLIEAAPVSDRGYVKVPAVKNTWS